MKSTQLFVFAVAATMALSLMTVPVIRAHAAGTDADASSAATSKQELKAEKKAEAKARRQKKNAELSQLQKNGYNPAGNQTNYPQNLQNAQQKAAGQKPGNAPAVAP
jgi:flagellar biosynthesis/type III secretory pathway M-ring protein FliF/YscJ